ncbi:MAG: hypothetical protein OHK0053_20890 [Microscillaceae bacterium]
MKNYRFYFSALMLLLSVGFWSCNEDEAIPSLDALLIEDFDLIQVTNDNTNVRVTVSAQDDQEITKITVNIFPMGMTAADAVATNSVSNIGTDNIRRININVPFPLPEVAPSGVYTVEYTIQDTEGKTSTKSYNVNILNYRTVDLSPCTFPSLPLPAGKNVWLFVTAPANTGGEDLYVSGNFEQEAGGTGDWTGGGTAALKFTKVEGSDYCYYIALNLDAAAEFKITRGDWGKVMKNADGSEADNIKWNNQGTQNFTVGNWADRIVLPPVSLPAAAIQPGKLTAVFDVGTDSNEDEFFIVEENATSLANAIQMVRVQGTTKMAAAIPKNASANYIVVKNDIANKGVNAYGFVQSVTWDGSTNPIENGVRGFDPTSPEINLNTLITNLVITGSATQSNWTGEPPANQSFTKISDSRYEIVHNFVGGGEYLILPYHNGWDFKFGRLGVDPAEGGFLKRTGDAGNLQGPANAGSYKLSLDFSKGSYGIYTLTAQ